MAQKYRGYQNLKVVLMHPLPQNTIRSYKYQALELYHKKVNFLLRMR